VLCPRYTAGKQGRDLILSAIAALFSGVASTFWRPDSQHSHIDLYARVHQKVTFRKDFWGRFEVLAPAAAATHAASAHAAAEAAATVTPWVGRPRNAAVLISSEVLRALGPFAPSAGVSVEVVHG